MVVIHGYGHSKDLYTPVVPLLRRAGWAGLLPDLPFHGDRRSPEQRKVPFAPWQPGTPSLFPFGGRLDYYVMGVQQIISDIGQCLAWLAGRREIDRDRLAVVGFSFGGVVVAVLMGLGLGLAAGVSLMAAGDWADLLFKSSLGGDSRGALEQAGVSLADADLALRDLSASSRAGDVKSLLIVGGRRDPLVPSEVIESFWSKLDQKVNRLVWKDSGHVPPVRSTAREVLGFLREKLRPNGSSRPSGTPRQNAADKEGRDGRADGSPGVPCYGGIGARHPLCPLW